MATQPRLTPGEAPLDDAAIDLLLSHMGTGMVLVGGQALAFWMLRFGIDWGGTAVSNDGDALGTAARAIELAQAINARIELPKKTGLTAIVAQLRLPTRDGKERNVDVLHQLYTVSGLKKSSIFTRRVIEDSVEVQWRPGRLIKVMDPFDLLESRAHNAVGLLEVKGPHVLTQAAWAVQVAREALMRIATAPESTPDRLGNKIQRVYTLARSQVGRRLLAEHGIELLDSVDVQALKAASPSHGKQLEAVGKARAARLGGRPAPTR